MKFTKASLLLQLSTILAVLCLQLSSAAFAQNSNGIDQVYGFDPLLYNGKVYYFYKPGTGGSQFLLTDFDISGRVTIRGVSYFNLAINYDIYNQQLILKYINQVGSTSLIILSEAWLENFMMGDKDFCLISDADTSRRIYQVIGEGSVKVLYYRTKELLLDNFKNGGMHYFSEPKCSRYIYRDSIMVNFSNNRSFLKTFEKENQMLIKKFLHEQKINVKNADDHSMKQLINYCNSLYKL